MGKFFLLYLLLSILGNPFLALIVVLIIFFLLDQRYTRWFARFVRKLQKAGRLRQLLGELAANPHHVSNKLEVGRLYADRKQFRRAVPYLEQALARMDHHAEGLFYLGWCYLRTGREQEGMAKIEEALALNPRVHYGEPYILLAKHFQEKGAEREALRQLDRASEAGLANAELAYRKGELHRRLGSRALAREAYDRAIEYYRTAPKYVKKEERRWALLARLARLRA